MESRTRYSRDDGIELVIFTPVPGAGNFKPGTVGPYPFAVKRFRSLFEVYTPNTIKGRRHEWKSFEHYKLAGTLASSSSIKHPTCVFTEHGGYAGSWYHIGEHQDVAFGARGLGPYDEIDVSPSPQYYGLDNKGNFIPDPVGLDDLLRVGTKACMAGIKSDMSLINSIIELKDFKSLAKGLITARTTLLAHKETIQRFLKRDWDKVKLHQLARASSQANLSYSFAWAPLVSDICSFMTAVRSWHDRLTTLLKDAEKPRTRRYSVSLSDERPDSEMHQFQLGPNAWQGIIHPSVVGTHTTRRETYPLGSKFHITTQYSFKLSEWQIAHARGLSILDALGVQLNPNIVWNAIPFSFLIDWVLGVSKFLDQFKVGNMEPVINIRNFCWSVSRRRAIHTYCKTGENSYGYQHTPERLVSSHIESAYRRQVGYPTISSLQESGLSLREISLGASLAITLKKWRPRKKKWH